MKKILSTLIVIFVAWGLMISDADARRFGGGRSFGMQRSATSYSRPSVAPAAGQAAGNRWLGPLAGLAVGGLLASMFMGHGLVSGILSWLLVGGVIMLIFNWFQRRNMPATPYNSRPNNYNNMNQVVNPFTSANVTSGGSSNYPAGFDSADFLRNAKVQFIRLQAAYDTKNTSDLRDFTAPEVFAEIQMQFQERNDAENHTDVISLDAELLDASTEADGMIASVRFTGMIKEEVNGSAAPFNETWHFRKNNIEQKWLLAGLQQNQ